jgi:hypothetical protein
VNRRRLEMKSQITASRQCSPDIYSIFSMKLKIQCNTYFCSLRGMDRRARRRGAATHTPRMALEMAGQPLKAARAEQDEDKPSRSFYSSLLLGRTVGALTRLP